MTVLNRDSKPQLSPQQLAANCLRQLAAGIEHRQSDVGDLLADLHVALEALPLDTEEFGVAHNRVVNVTRYVRRGEWGAAQYELRLLERRSLSWFKESTAVERRKPVTHRTA